jgi:hypothetical protein
VWRGRKGIFRHEYQGFWQDLRAARANRVFCADEKHIRTENTVVVNTETGAGVNQRSSIAHGCAFHPCAIDDPRGRLPSARAALRPRRFSKPLPQLP